MTGYKLPYQEEFLFSHFKILTKNIYSTQSRKLSEGLFITISEPELNRQVFHKKCLLFCSCLSDRIPPDKAICTQSPWGLIRRIHIFRKFLEYVAPVKKNFVILYSVIPWRCVKNKRETCRLLKSDVRNKSKWKRLNEAIL